ncbi:hypothetical protein [Thermoactinomyces mirandus]|uniref:Uncharacterized protein n=1 Tax=Thermoactinomyces mirandus TaxID=2756294 RepID=A0A7W2AR44_9BACL|nr:hypothetical protein [Thermoactinomyces mirandus]MBA4601190.1 hypothetical protein [Thermoactinomyces mirandus]
MLYNDPLEISFEEWLKLLADSEVSKEPYTEILKIVYESNYSGICAFDIAAKLKVARPFNM